MVFVFESVGTTLHKLWSLSKPGVCLVSSCGHVCVCVPLRP